MKINFGIAQPRHKGVGKNLLFGSFVIYRKSKSQPLNILLRPLRLTIFSGILAFLVYLVSGIGLYFWLDRSPHNVIRPQDILLPWNWSSLSEKRGKTRLAHGQALRDEGRWIQAVQMIRTGLARYPADIEARTFLVTVYAQAGYLSESLRYYEEGLEYGGDDLNYLFLGLELGQRTENHALVRDAAERIESNPELELTDEQEIQVKAFQIRAFLGDALYREALQAIEDFELPGNMPISPFLSEKRRALLGLGEADAALDEFRELSRRFPNSAAIQLNLAEIFRETNDRESFQRISHLLLSQSANLPEIYLTLMTGFNQFGMEDSFELLLREYLIGFRDRTESLQQLGRILAEMGRTSELSRLARRMIDSGFDPAPAYLAQIFAYLKGGEVAQAEQAIATMSRSREPFLPEATAGEQEQVSPDPYQSYIQNAQLLLQIIRGEGEGVEKTLATNLQRGFYPASTFLELDQILSVYDKDSFRVDLLNQATQSFPFSKNLEEALEKASLDMEQQREERAQAVADARNPLLDDPQAAIEQLEKWLQEGESTKISELLNSLRIENVSWFSQYEERLERIRLQNRISLLSADRVKETVSYFISKFPNRISDLPPMAQFFADREDYSRASAILESLVSRPGGNEEAEALLEQWKDMLPEKTDSPSAFPDVLASASSGIPELPADMDNYRRVRDDLLDAQEFETLARLISSALNSQEEWVAQNRFLLDWEYLRALGMSGDSDRILSRLSLFSARYPDRVPELQPLVEELRAAGQSNTAQLLKNWLNSRLR